MISKKNKKHEANNSRAELEIFYPRYVVRHPNRLANCKSIGMLNSLPYEDNTKDSMHQPLSNEKSNRLRRPSHSQSKPSKTKRKSLKASNNRETPHRNVSDRKLTVISNHEVVNCDKSRLAATLAIPSKDILRHVYAKCSRLLSDYRQKVDALEKENREFFIENQQLKERLVMYEHESPVS